MRIVNRQVLFSFVFMAMAAFGFAAPEFSLSVGVGASLTPMGAGFYPEEYDKFGTYDEYGERYGYDHFGSRNMYDKSTKNVFGGSIFLDATYGGFGLGIVNGNVNYLDIGLFLKYPFAWGKKVSFFPLLGFNMQKVLEDTGHPLDRIVLNTGIGLDWNITEKLYIRTEGRWNPVHWNLESSRLTSEMGAFFNYEDFSVKLAVGWKLVGGNVLERISRGHDVYDVRVQKGKKMDEKLYPNWYKHRDKEKAREDNGYYYVVTSSKPNAEAIRSFNGSVADAAYAENKEQARKKMMSHFKVRAKDADKIGWYGFEKWEEQVGEEWYSGWKSYQVFWACHRIPVTSMTDELARVATEDEEKLRIAALEKEAADLQARIEATNASTRNTDLAYQVLYSELGGKQREIERLNESLKSKGADPVYIKEIDTRLEKLVVYREIYNPVDSQQHEMALRDQKINELQLIVAEQKGTISAQEKMLSELAVQYTGLTGQFRGLQADDVKRVDDIAAAVSRIRVTDAMRMEARQKGKTEPEKYLKQIQKGDSLAQIAKARYGSAWYYEFLYRVNRNMIPSGTPDVIRVGTELLLPDLPPDATLDALYKIPAAQPVVYKP